MQMPIRTVFWVSLWGVLALGGTAQAQDLQRPHLNQAWTLYGFQDPESVVFDPLQNCFYVSNMNGPPQVKDGNGFISKVSADGKMLDKAWVTGLNAPTGLAIAGRKLYAADIDELVEITLADRKVTKYPAPGAKFLNDTAADYFGHVYVSDMLNDSIWRFSGGKFSLWVKNPLLASPNGVFAEKTRLVVGSWGVIDKPGFQTTVPGHLVTVSLADGKVAPLGDGRTVGNIDGVEADGNGNYFVTDWVAGKLFLVSPSGDFVPVADLGQGSADLTYLRQSRIMVVPLMKENRLVAYELDDSDDRNRHDEDNKQDSPGDSSHY